MREYRQELHRLQAERAAAQAAGDPEEVARLEGEMEALKSALKESGSAADTGERARNNVRKAIGVVMCSVPRSFRELAPIGLRMNREGARRCWVVVSST
jgi:hypothetical protein